MLNETVREVANITLNLFLQIRGLGHIQPNEREAILVAVEGEFNKRVAEVAEIKGFAQPMTKMPLSNKPVYGDSSGG